MLGAEHGGHGEEPRRLPAGGAAGAEEGDGHAAEEDPHGHGESCDRLTAVGSRQSGGRLSRSMFVSTATAGDGHSPEVPAVHAVLDCCYHGNGAASCFLRYCGYCCKPAALSWLRADWAVCVRVHVGVCSEISCLMLP